MKIKKKPPLVYNYFANPNSIDSENPKKSTSPTSLQCTLYGFVRQKKAEEDAHFGLEKGGIFFPPLFCLTNPALV
jgi:ABC-type oligopeptide transport system substrate-binding subunit